MGKSALPALRLATRHKDAEIRRRAEILIGKLDFRRDEPCYRGRTVAAWQQLIRQRQMAAGIDGCIRMAKGPERESDDADALLLPQEEDQALLLALLRSRDPKIRALAAYCVGGFTEPAPDAVAALIIAWRDKDEVVRVNAGLSLFLLDPEAAEAVGVSLEMGVRMIAQRLEQSK
jgi:hypothetical protein